MLLQKYDVASRLQEIVAQEIIAPLRTIVEPIAELSADTGWKDLQRLLDEDYPNGKYYY